MDPSADPSPFQQFYLSLSLSRIYSTVHMTVENTSKGWFGRLGNPKTTKYGHYYYYFNSFTNMLPCVCSSFTLSIISPPLLCFTRVPGAFVFFPTFFSPLPTLPQHLLIIGHARFCTLIQRLLHQIIFWKIINWKAKNEDQDLELFLCYYINVYNKRIINFIIEFNVCVL